MIMSNNIKTNTDFILEKTALNMLKQQLFII
jgi:hypothetical protein